MKSYNIQGLRGLAAYAVVAHHIIDSFRNYIAIGQGVPDVAIGSTGVDVFFVISGYVMALTTSSKDTKPIQFIINRAIRVVPMYWILTAFATILLLSGFKIFGNYPVTGLRVFSSLLFLPYFGESPSPILPILFPGWTLNYEVMFYITFSVFLIIRNVNTRLFSVVFFITFIWLLQVAIDEKIIDYLGDDIIISFSLGIVLWMITQRTSVSLFISCIFLVIALPGLAVIDIQTIKALPHFHVIISISAALLVGAAIFLEKNGISIGRGWLSKQGDASYSLYLIHPFVIQVIGKLVTKIAIPIDLASGFIIAVMMIAACAVSGWITHRYLENPINKMLRGRSLEAAMETK